MEGSSNWASRTRKRGEACGEQPECGGEWAAKTVKRPLQQPAHPQCANYRAPLTRKRHDKEHQPQRPLESIDPTQHAKGRRGGFPGLSKETMKCHTGVGVGGVQRLAFNICIPQRGGKSFTCLKFLARIANHLDFFFFLPEEDISDVGGWDH